MMQCILYHEKSVSASHFQEKKIGVTRSSRIGLNGHDIYNDGNLEFIVFVLHHQGFVCECQVTTNHGQSQNEI